jgi:AraC-like DNA-binding protein
LTAAVEQLNSAFVDPGSLPTGVRQEVLRHLLAVLVLRLAHANVTQAGPAPRHGDAFLRFRDAVERRHASRDSLSDYARALGYSPRTLSRATLTAAGVTAKEFLDRRVVVEAQRLLAHSDRTAAQIATNLGFTSATHFSKFFHLRTGATPIAFRESVRGSGG